MFLLYYALDAPQRLILLSKLIDSNNESTRIDPNVWSTKPNFNGEFSFMYIYIQTLGGGGSLFAMGKHLLETHIHTLNVHFVCFLYLNTSFSLNLIVSPTAPVR